MTFFKELNLPAPVVSERMLDKIYVLKLKDNTYTKIITDVDQYLNPELIHKCKSVGVTPYFFIAFGRDNCGSSSVHRDIALENNKWADFPVAVNWELTPGTTTWTWWDTGDEPKLYPPIDESPLLHGQHFKYRGNKSPAGFKLLETYNVTSSQAVLYRSDVAHLITYNSPAKHRRCISVRFSLKEIPTWERALEIFQPLFA